MQQIEQQAEATVAQQLWEAPELVKAEVSAATLIGGSTTNDGITAS